MTMTSKNQFQVELNQKVGSNTTNNEWQIELGFFQRPSPAVLGTCFCARCGILVKKFQLCKLCHSVNYCSRECSDRDRCNHCLLGTCRIFSMLERRAQQGEFGVADPKAYSCVQQDPFYSKQIEAINEAAPHFNVSRQKLNEIQTQMYRLVGCQVCLQCPQNAQLKLCNVCHMAAYCSKHKDEFEQIHTKDQCCTQKTYGTYASTVFCQNLSPLVVVSKDLRHSNRNWLNMKLFSKGWMGWITHILHKNFKSVNLGESDFKSMTNVMELYYSDVCTLLYAAILMQQDFIQEQNLVVHMVDFTGSLRYEDKIKSFEMLLHVIPGLKNLQLVIMEPPGSTCTIQKPSFHSVPTCKKCEELHKSMDVIYSNMPLDTWMQSTNILYSTPPNVCIWYNVDHLFFDDNCIKTLFKYLQQFRDANLNSTPVILTFGWKILMNEIADRIFEKNKEKVVYFEGNPFGCELPAADEKIMYGSDVLKNQYILCLRD